MYKVTMGYRKQNSREDPNDRDQFSTFSGCNPLADRFFGSYQNPEVEIAPFHFATARLDMTIHLPHGIHVCHNCLHLVDFYVKCR